MACSSGSTARIRPGRAPLAIVRGLVAAHGGIASVRTAPGQGATFRIALPLAPEAQGGLAADDDSYLDEPGEADEMSEASNTSDVSVTYGTEVVGEVEAAEEADIVGKADVVGEADATETQPEATRRAGGSDDGPGQAAFADR